MREMLQIFEHISVDRLIPTHDQPRSVFDNVHMEELAQSVKNHGILQPLIVSDNNHGTYRIVAGERRWRAAKMAGLSAVPCIIRDMKEHERLEIAIIENIQREAMSPIDEARAYKKLAEEYDYTHEIIAEKLGKSRSVITNALRLLDLPKNIIDELRANKITSAHARALSGVSDTQLQQKLFQDIVSRKLSVRDTEDLIRKQSTKKKKKNQKKEMCQIQTVDSDLKHICELLKDRFGTSVRIVGNSNKGVVEFAYYSMADLQRFLDSVLKNPLDRY
jgi:ParB family chromosome partitioning protein